MRVKYINVNKWKNYFRHRSVVSFASYSHIVHGKMLTHAIYTMSQTGCIFLKNHRVLSTYESHTLACSIPVLRNTCAHRCSIVVGSCYSPAIWIQRNTYTMTFDFCRLCLFHIHVSPCPNTLSRDLFFKIIGVFNNSNSDGVIVFLLRVHFFFFFLTRTVF